MFSARRMPGMPHHAFSYVPIKTGQKRLASVASNGFCHVSHELAQANFQELGSFRVSNAA